MSSIEKKILEWIENNIIIVAFAAVSVIGLIIRWMAMEYISGDYTEYLLPWYETLQQNGGIKGLGEQVGNYNMLYQLLVAIMTYIPIEPLYAYKIQSIIFDYFLAIIVMLFVRDLSEKDKEVRGIIAYAIVIMSPIVFMDSAVWAQSDAIYSFFVIASLYFLFREKYIPAFILLGIALSLKLQAGFILPFYLFLYFYKKQFSILHFFILPGVMCITSLPNVMMGRNILDVFTNYLEQTSYYEQIARNYPSFWLIFCSEDLGDSYGMVKNIAIMFTLAVLGIMMVCFIAGRISMNKKNQLYIAFLLTYACVLFVPSMHERYGYVYDILAIIIAVINLRTIPSIVVLNLISLTTYGKYLFGNVYNIKLFSTINFISFVVYVMILMADMKCRKSKQIKISEPGSE